MIIKKIEKNSFSTYALIDISWTIKCVDTKRSVTILTKSFKEAEEFAVSFFGNEAYVITCNN